MDIVLWTRMSTKRKMNARLTVGGIKLNIQVINQLTPQDSKWRKILSTAPSRQIGQGSWSLTLKMFILKPLGRYEYMVINLTWLPQEVIDEYNLHMLVHDGRVYIEIHKGMYGLPQSRILMNELLQWQLALDGYHLTEHM
jgi:hypothetical protein